jgi:Ca-activated chloride channel family protein
MVALPEKTAGRAILIGIAFLLVAMGGCAGEWRQLWLTTDQYAQKLSDAGEHNAAAELFTDPMRAGAEWYRAGEFDRAAADFGRLSSADAQFNRGNALVFLGKYESAIAAYEFALQARPDWLAADENLRIAKIRMARLDGPDDDAGGTGGQLAADEIVFDLDGSSGSGSGEETVEGDTGIGDEQLRELWLRRVETRPADFLAARFAYQLVRQSEPDNE